MSIGQGGADQTKAHEIADSFKSPRYRYIDRLEHYVTGTQYKGRPNWWTALDTPIAEREPCVVYPIARIARDSFVDLVLGEHRFPKIDIAKVESDELRLAFRRARFEAATREALAAGLGTSSAAVIVGIREGRPFIDTVPSKWCRPEFAGDQRTVTQLEIEYPFVVEERDPSDGKWKAKARLFRRVIDKMRDVTFKPVELVDATTEPKWVEDKDRIVEHKLGYCPVIWWAAMRGACVEGRYDGHALHEHMLDAITAHDLAISQRQNAAFLAGSPQWIEIGVEPGYNPSPGARPMRVPATPDGGPLAAGQRASSSYVTGGASAARKKGPGQVWQYPDPLTKVQLEQLASGALDALDKNARDIRLKICDGLAYVPQDPDTIPLHGISGKALESLKEKQLSRCDYLRDDAGDGLLVPLVVMLCRVTGLGGDDVDDEAVTLDWPPYYMPNAEDRSKELAAEVAAMTQGASFVSVPEFKTTAQKRMTRLVLDGASDDDLEAIEDAIDAAAEAAKAQAAMTPPGTSDPNAPPQDPNAPAPTGAPNASSGAASAAPSGPPAPTGPGNTGASPAPAPAKAGKVLPIMPKARAAAKSAQPAQPAQPTTAAVTHTPGSPNSTAGVPTLAANAHLRASNDAATAYDPGVAETVYNLLKSDYPKDAIEWVRHANIEGPRLVPLSQIDFTNREAWSASGEDISSYVDKIADGTMKPIVLVNEPNDEKLMIIDGHHRSLAYDQLGQPAMAYVIHTNAVGGPWDAMHSSQKNENGEPVLTSRQK